MDHIYSGFKEVFVSVDLLNQFYVKGYLALSVVAKEAYLPNQFLLMKDELGGSSSAVGIVDEANTICKKIKVRWGAYLGN